jgi:hypothetical protein
MLGRLAERARERGVADRLEIERADVRSFALDRLFRFVYLPFNTLLVLTEPHDRERALTRVRQHLAPSGTFAFDIFNPDPRMLIDEPEWSPELEHEADDLQGRGRVHVLRERRTAHDFGRQLKHIDFRHTITSTDGRELARWEDSIDIALIYPNELQLILEREGFRIRRRYGGPDRRLFAPTATDTQAQFVAAELAS